MKKLKLYNQGNKPQFAEQGFVVIVAIVVMAILITMSSSIWGYSYLQVKSSRQVVERSQVLQIAEAGIDKAIHELNNDPGFSGESGVSVGAGQFTTTITSIDSSNKEIVSTGYIPNSTNPKQEVVVKTRVTIDLSTVAFNFGVQVGVGGLSMSNGSQVIGNIYSNGNITGSGTISGDATVAGGGATIADQQCQTAINNFDFNVSSQRDVAQRFRPTSTGGLSKIAVYLKKTGSPSNITVRILQDDGVDPNKTEIGGSGTISSSLVTNNYGWIEATFSSTPQLTAGTDYWLLLDTSSTSSNYYTWAYDDDNGCSNGKGAYTSSWNAGSNPSYTILNRDFNFRTFMGGAPTSLSGITVTGDARATSLNSCTIGGDAYYATTNTCSVTGSSNSGQADQPQQSMPISQAQIDEWKSVATSGGTYSGNYTVTGTDTLGPYKIDGDLIIGINATLYLTGPLWVNGNITTNNNSKILVAGTLGNSGTVIIADSTANPSTKGVITISNNATIAGNGNPDSFPLVISAKTGSGAISLNNNTAGAIYYAANGEVLVSNNAGALQLTGNSINLSNNATITYNTGLVNANFSNGPGGSWAKVAGSYIIIWQ